MQDDLPRRVLGLLRGSTDTHGESVELLRQPHIATRLLRLIVDGVVPPHATLLSATLLQKALRRSPLEECPDTLTLLHALRAAIASHQRVLATHLGLAAAVRLLRSPEWPPEQLLARVGAALLPNDAPCAALLPTTADCAAFVLVMTLLAEELHAPAARLSVPPARLAAVRAALRHDAASLLASLHAWSGGGHVAPAPLLERAAALRCATAWCTAGLVAPRACAESALLAVCACGLLATARARQLICRNRHRSQTSSTTRRCNPANRVREIMRGL